MLRTLLLSIVATSLLVVPASAAGSVRGKYVEARTCQIYTGPCFANGEVGSTGKDAIMTWRIDSGELDGVPLSGLGVAVVLKTSHTLGFNGLKDPQKTEALLLIDDSANQAQFAALRSFLVSQTNLREEQIVSTQRSSFKMQFDLAELTATVDVGEFAHVQARKARPGDCICSNEAAYYPPLVSLQGSVPGVTIDGSVKARCLGRRWSIPDTRTAYLGTFQFDAELSASQQDTVAKR